MAPRGATLWRRPYTSIYNDNYKYGTGLYSDTLSDIEKRYSDSISRTQLRSDRPDLTFQTFSGSNLASSPQPGGDSTTTREHRENPVFTRQISSSSPLPEVTRSPTFENRLNATLNSAAHELDEEVADAIRARIERRKLLAKSASESQARSKLEEDEPSSNRPKSLYDDATYWTLPKTSEKYAELDLDKPKSKRKVGGRLTPTNGPSSQWRDKSRNLQDQVDSLEKSMSDASSRLRNELSSLKSRYHTEISDLSNSVESTSQQANDLQKQCKRQANQILDLQSAYDDAQRNISSTLEEMSVWQNKCKFLKKEMDRLKEEVEAAVSRKSKA